MNILEINPLSYLVDNRASWDPSSYPTLANHQHPLNVIALEIEYNAEADRELQIAMMAEGDDVWTDKDLTEQLFNDRTFYDDFHKVMDIYYSYVQASAFDVEEWNVHYKYLKEHFNTFDPTNCQSRKMLLQQRLEALNSHFLCCNSLILMPSTIELREIRLKFEEVCIDYIYFIGSNIASKHIIQILKNQLETDKSPEIKKSTHRALRELDKVFVTPPF